VTVVVGRSVTRRLGGGSDYEVYEATDDAFGSVVLKFLRPDLVSAERSLRRLRRECDLLLELRHPKVVRVLDAAFDGPRPHLVLERVEGPSLKTALREGPLLPEKVGEIGVSLASALAFLADNGVVHLDVKPSNVILDSRATLIDFSVARHVADAAVLRRPVGTDIWMAPEQCEPQHRGPVGPAADVWGLAATLWRALLGKPPFKRRKGYDRVEVSQRFPQLSTVPRALPERVPAPFADLLATCLNPDPALRPSAAEVAAGLSGLSQPIPA
jgi:serine/threonine protein kinase